MSELKMSLVTLVSLFSILFLATRNWTSDDTKLKKCIDSIETKNEINFDELPNGTFKVNTPDLGTCLVIKGKYGKLGREHAYLGLDCGCDFNGVSGEPIVQLTSDLNLDDFPNGLSEIDLPEVGKVTVAKGHYGSFDRQVGYFGVSCGCDLD